MVGRLQPHERAARRTEGEVANGGREVTPQMLLAQLPDQLAVPDADLAVVQPPLGLQARERIPREVHLTGMGPRELVGLLLRVRPPRAQPDQRLADLSPV